MSGILGRKVGMTRISEDDGTMVPVSVIECLPNEILQVKTTERDGYPALILGFLQFNKPTKTKKFRHVTEFRLLEEAAQKKGDKVTVETLKEVKQVQITGWSKGRGFAGVIKRHKFSRGPETHGSHHHRQPGSSSGPVSGTGRVPKGKRFPGHMGCDRVTKRGVKVVAVDLSNNIIAVKGSVPGAPNGLIKITI